MPVKVGSAGSRPAARVPSSPIRRSSSRETVRGMARHAAMPPLLCHATDAADREPRQLKAQGRATLAGLADRTARPGTLDNKRPATAFRR